MKGSCFLLGLVLSSCYQDPRIRVPDADQEPFRQSLDSSPLVYQSVGTIDSISNGSGALSTSAAFEAKADNEGAASGDALEGDKAEIAETAPAATEPSSAPDADPAPTPAAQDFSNGVYLIQGAGSGRCLDVTEGRADDGLQLQIWDCGESNANQLMTIEYGGEGYYRIMTGAGKALDGGKENPAAGAPLLQNKKSSASGQRFSIRIANDSVRLVMRGTELQVAVRDGATANGSLLQLAPFKAESSQRWILRRCEKKVCKPS